MIQQGKVRVNGKVVSDLGSKASPTDTILVNNRPLPVPQTVVYALNKPKGVVSTRVAQSKDPVVTDLVPPYPRVYPVGRLDKESEGLILLTNDGELAQKLTHPSYKHPKGYWIKAKWEKKATQKPTEWLEAQMLKGIKLGDGLAKADKVKIKADTFGNLSIDITVHEGRKHLLRRMCGSLGLEVTLLRRTKFGTLLLEPLKIGSHRVLTTQERQSLTAS